MGAIPILLARPARSIGCATAWHVDSCRFDPLVRQHSFLEIGHEIISTAILPVPLIQVGQLSVSGQRMCTKYWLTAEVSACPGKVWLG